jgi:phage baseplate assembly protein V
MFAVERDSALTGGVGSRGQTEVERTVAGLIMHGRVVAADYPNARLRVGIGDPEDPEGYITTGWLPMAQAASNEWNPIKIGEAVTVLSEGGELQNGHVIRAAINNTDMPAIGDRGDLWRKQFEDGSVIEFDEAEGAYLVDAKQKATVRVGDSTVEALPDKITLTAGGASITIEAGHITLSAGGATYRIGGGHQFTAGTITHDGVVIDKTHLHGGVLSGPANTDVPVGG